MKFAQKILPMLKAYRRWLWPIGLMVVGLIVYLVNHGFATTAVVLYGIAAVLIAYFLLEWLRKTRPKAGKCLTWIFSVCLAIGVAVAGVTAGLVIAAGTVQPESGCEYIVVLGAKVNGTSPSLALAERIEAAYAYLKENPDALCIVSGGQGSDEDISEAQCIYDQLTQKGIDPQRIWLEEKATSTADNLQFSLELIEEKTGQRPEKIGIVSSEYHMFRAGMVANGCGVACAGIPAKSTRVDLYINYTLREIAAVWYYLILGG